MCCLDLKSVCGRAASAHARAIRYSCVSRRYQGRSRYPEPSAGSHASHLALRAVSRHLASRRACGTGGRDGAPQRRLQCRRRRLDRRGDDAPRALARGGGRALGPPRGRARGRGLAACSACRWRRGRAGGCGPARGAGHCAHLQAVRVLAHRSMQAVHHRCAAVR